MGITKDGLALIKQFEQCVLTAYQDQEGVWTIGWGRTRGVRAGDVCSQEQADAWFAADIAEFERLVINCIGPLVSLNNNQLSALISFCYNVGLGYKGDKDGFQVLKNGEPSTLLKYLRVANFPLAAMEFLKWDKVGGQVCAGILRRRIAEQALFLKPEEADAET